MNLETSDGVLFDKIGGWLILPAFIHPVMGVITNLQGSYELLQMYTDNLPFNAKAFFITVGALGIAYAMGWVISAYLAGSLSPVFPRYYIALNILGVIGPLIILATTVFYFNVPAGVDDYKDVLKNSAFAIVWVPYMLLSRRVKATYYDIPMRRTRVQANVSSPLKLAAGERASYVNSRRNKADQDLTMVQRLGMVLYWACAGIATLLAVAGLYALFNAPDKFAVLLCLVGAGACLLVGLAVRYVLVGR